MSEYRTITRQQLFELVWSKPTSQAARELGISDVGLGNICQKLGVPKPGRGYWAKVSKGQQPPRENSLYEGNYPDECEIRPGPKSRG